MYNLCFIYSYGIKPDGKNLRLPSSDHKKAMLIESGVWLHSYKPRQPARSGDLAFDISYGIEDWEIFL